MFQVPASKRSIKQNRFEFEHDGKKYSLPLLKFLPFAAAESFEQGHQATAVIQACDDDRTRDVLRSLDSEQMEALLTAWGDASGVSVGESEASSSS